MPEKRNNLFRHTIKRDKESKVMVSESELLRILKCLEGKQLTDKDVDSIVSLKVGKNMKKYDHLIDKNGYIKLAKYECKYEKKYDKSSGNIKSVKNAKVTHRQDKDIEVFKSMLTGAGHSRNCKSLFIRTDVVNRMNKILLCGIPSNVLYKSPAKWNSYYAMCTTDTEPVKELPNILVIDDFEKYVTEYADEVEEYINADGDKQYKVNNNVRQKVKIKPFDGAGLVTPQCAAKWALELNIRNKKGKRYIPAAFQFRAIPGIKGELFVIDIYRFMEENNVRFVRDVWGKTWDLKKHRVDCILTKSQFKFYDLYSSYEHWRKEFQKELYGYRRTFNIASYAEHPNDLRKITLISYQPLQTVCLTDEEIQRLTKYGIELFKGICTDINEFIKYRGLLSNVEEDNQLAEEILPSYYKALLKCPELFNDKYVYSKIEEDVKKLRNDLLVGKVIVEGNYQILTPDILGLLQYAFHMPVNGLLRKGQIYSSYWSSKGIKQVDIIRSPHITHEHRIGYLRNSDKMHKWYEYQTTGILTSMYDTYLLALGGADTDGDHVCCTPNKDIINAVKRELEQGHGRTVVFKQCAHKGKDRSLRVNDTAGLMKVNKDSFSNDIGTVINEISKLWSMDLTDEIRDMIKICSCIGGLVIDFAKTGEPAEIPKDILDVVKNRKRPYFMRYLPQNLDIAKQEDNAVKKAYLKYNEDCESIKELRRFSDLGSGNMDRLCQHAEIELNGIGNLKIQENKEFDFNKLLLSVPKINRNVRKVLCGLQETYQCIGQEKNMEKIKGRELAREYKSRYKYFFDYCKSELLTLGVDANTLIDMLITIFYTDKKFVAESKQKDILWNTFGEELVKRCMMDYTLDEKKIQSLKARKHRNCQLYQKHVLKKRNSKKVVVETLDKYCDSIITITRGDRDAINKSIKFSPDIKGTNRIDACRLFAVLLMIVRKTGSTKIIKYYNKPYDITDSSLSKLSGVDIRKIEVLLQWYRQHGLIDLCVMPNSNVKINLDFVERSGKIWLQSDNYNQVCTSIRDYFRK